MARLTRRQLLYDGCYAHVISRSIGKNKVFKDNQDFLTFRDMLLKIKSDSGFKVFHYCLMHTHFHLVVEVPEVSLFSKGLQKLKSQYIYKYHTRYKECGPIWRDRYKSLLIENENYLYACGQYIENNPIKAGLVKESVEWEYSCARYYLKGYADQIIDKYDCVNKELIKDIDIVNEGFFEKGVGIGSDFYRFKLSERLKKRQEV